MRVVRLGDAGFPGPSRGAEVVPDQRVGQNAEQFLAVEHTVAIAVAVGGSVP